MPVRPVVRVMALIWYNGGSYLCLLQSCAGVCKLQAALLLFLAQQASCTARAVLQNLDALLQTLHLDGSSGALRAFFVASVVVRRHRMVLLQTLMASPCALCSCSCCRCLGSF